MKQLAVAVRNKMSREFIDAADRYGIVGLKIIVETALVKRHVMNIDNVADWILFADAKNCSLLKEHAKNYFLVMAKDVLKSKASEKLMESPKLIWQNCC